MPHTIRDSGFRFFAALVSLAIALILPLPPVCDLPAQTTPLRFAHLTVDDGLSQNLVHAILQDRKGFMWFGTKDGLNRYDGYQFTVFRHDPYDSTSISGHEINLLYEDRTGNLWIGSAGLNRFDRTSETFVRYLHDPANPNSLSHNEVHAIAEDPQLDGTLWIGTAHGLQTAKSKQQKANSEKQGGEVHEQQSIDPLVHQSTSPSIQQSIDPSIQQSNDPLIPKWTYNAHLLHLGWLLKV